MMTTRRWLADRQEEMRKIEAEVRAWLDRQPNED
jgi:hypothetical protein